MNNEYPVFYDRSGKRLRRVVTVAAVLLLAIGALVACVAPAALSPTGGAADETWPRRYLSGLDPNEELAAIGDPDHAVLTRLLRVDRDGLGFRLLDPVTGEFIRYAEPWERDEIGVSPFVIDHYTTVPDRTIILTFDDGPDPVYTGQILDVLSANHVPATFFVMGERVTQHPDLLERIVREGHTVGNHTWSHPDFDQQTDFRNQQEVVQTDRVIRAAGDYNTRLFRIPTGGPEVNTIAQLTAQQLGYLTVDWNLDSNDWRYVPGQDVPVPPLDGRGHVILLHDGGGQSRAATVAMLQRLIPEARAQGYTFAPLTSILPPDYVPHRNVSSSVADEATLLTAQVAYDHRKVLTGVFFFGVGSTVIFTGFYLLLSIVNERRQRRRVWRSDVEWPHASVVLAAYNEETVIARTLDTLRASDYPSFEVVAVNDGSTDGTLAVLRAYEWDRLTVVDQANSGKSTAINNGVRHAADASTVIITMDADTLFRRDTVRNLARHFIPPRPGAHRRRKVGAVAGHVKVGNRNNVLTAWQSLEYLNGICVIRMAEMMVGAVGIVPGACSAWLRSALDEIGGFTENTLAEDADAAMALQRLRYRVLHDNHALCDTEAPETIRPLLKQRKRWMFGNFQVMWKNRGMLLRPRYGMLGMVTMPFSVLQLVLNFVFMPILLGAGALAVAQGDWRPVAIGAGIIFAVHVVTAAAAVGIARERWWHLAVLPIYRPIYEAMRVYLLYACAYRVLKGAEFAWDKLERRNSVVAVIEGVPA